MGIVYITAEILGAFLGYGVLKLVIPSEIFSRGKNGTGPGFCVNHPNPRLNVYQGFGIEFMLSMILILICCGIWDPRNAKKHDSVSLRFGFAISGLCITGV